MSEQGLTRDHIIWAYRILLDRDPENDAVILPKMKGYRTTKELRSDMVTSEEYRDKNRDFAQTNERNIVIKELESGVRLFVDLADHAIGLNIIRGRFEAAELAFVRRHLREGDVAVDAGAHIGFFAMHMAQAVGPRGHVYAFEPFGPNADLLTQAAAENGFTDRMTIERAAVGAEDGTAELVFARHTLNSGGAFLKGASGAPEGHATERVRVCSLDRYSMRRPVRFLKMDVEGAEPLVVQGASRLLREDRPVIMTEVHREQLARVTGLSAEDFIARMRQIGYTCQAIQGDGTGAALPRLPDAPLMQIALVPA